MKLTILIIYLSFSKRTKFRRRISKFVVIVMRAQMTNGSDILNQQDFEYHT